MADIFEALSNDHREIDDLLRRARQNTDDGLVRQVCDALALHARVEEAVLYPEVRRIVDGGDDIADGAEAEHAAIRTLIAQIQEAPPVDLAGVLDALQRDVEAHVRVEESEIFPALRECGVDAEELGRRIEAARGAAAAPRSGAVG
jgi:hemerythrin superfamily protein